MNVLQKIRSRALAGPALTALLVALSGCSLDVGGVDPSQALPAKDAAQKYETGGSRVISNPVEKRKEPSIEIGPAPPQGQSGEVSVTKQLPNLTGQVADVTIEQMPIPAFINTILGDTLHLNYQIDPKVSSKTDVVTLRTGGSKSAEELLLITREVLRSYGISLSAEKDLIRVRLSESLTSEMPQIIIGRTSADIAENLRPVFQVLVLDHVNNQDMASWLSSAFGGKIKFIPSPANNSIILLGLPDDVRSATEGIRLLDQPRLAGRQSLRITPVFWTAATLAEKLGDVLRAEGYNVSSAPVPPAAVTLLPLPTANMVLAFASDTKILEHIRNWVKDLDRPAQVDPRQSVFYYPVRNTTADSLVKVLNEVLTGDVTSSGTSNDLREPGLLARAGQQQQPKPQGGDAKATSGNAKFIPDTARNAIIFLGSAESYDQVLPLIQSLDQAPREVLIEVTIAVVTLSDSQTLGLEWSKLGADVGGSILSVAGGGGVAPFTTATPGGLNLMVLSQKNSVQATLSALQEVSNTKVVSTPRLLARSGATAKFQAGTDIPVVTSQVGGSGFNTGSTLQSVNYVNTGNLVQVKPVIYAGNQIDLDISQQQSQADTTAGSSVGGSPPIDDQNVSTQLSLTDGQTVLLGGFITETKSSSENGVPGLMDVPYVGSLFRSNSIAVQRKETLIFITPYIINTGADSQKIIDSVRDNLDQYPPVHQTLVY